jgi:hypothetical protein
MKALLWLPSLTLALTLASGQEEAPAKELPALFFNPSVLAAETAGDAHFAVRNLAYYVNQNHADVFRVSVHSESFAHGDVRLVFCAELRGDEDMARATERFQADPEWRKLQEDFERYEGDARAAILIPVTGRRATGLAGLRAWRTYRVSMADFPRALKALRDAVDHVNATHAGAAEQLYSQEIGEFGVLHWFADYADWSAWQRARKELLEDERYLSLTAAVGAVVEGGVETVMLDRL